MIPAFGAAGGRLWMLHQWELYALAIVICLFSFGLGVCAMIGPGRPAAREVPVPPLPLPMPLPRPGRFTLVEDRPVPPPVPPDDLWDTTPLILLSEHRAIIDATGREADQMNAAWRRKYLH